MQNGIGNGNSNSESNDKANDKGYYRYNASSYSNSLLMLMFKILRTVTNSKTEIDLHLLAFVMFSENIFFFCNDK